MYAYLNQGNINLMLHKYLRKGNAK